MLQNKENQTIENAFDPEMWGIRANGYKDLGWVGNTVLLTKIGEMLELSSSHVVIDAGAGSLAVSKTIAPLVSVVYAFDISQEMLANAQDVPNNVNINEESTSIYENGYDNFFADYIVSRMVFHHLDNIEAALLESLRVIKNEGSMLIVEYVVPDEDCLKFETAVFSIKEPGRHLWTPRTLMNDIASYLSKDDCDITVETETMEQYSVGNWLSKSGLPAHEQAKMFSLYQQASSSVRETMNMRFIQYSRGKIIDVNPEEAHDVLVDRSFAYLKITKK